LSSRINAARRAIGDNGNDQLFIKTLHKRGFRFVGEVEADGVVTAAPPAEVLQEVPSTESAMVPMKSEATKPSIAVLPVENLSGDPEHEYFGYGMTEDLIRLLARNRWLTVISRHSTIGFKGQTHDMRTIGEALSVRYIVVGSVRRTSDLVR